MDAAGLSVFAAVARAGGITSAARALHTVQSNVTQRIRLLERELGVPLFHRHSRGVSLTSAGAELLPYAERIGRLLEEAKQVAASGRIARGRIVIGALETATAVRLPPLLAAYAKACPDVDIDITTGTSAALVEAVLAHRLEAAFVAGPVKHPELVTVPIVEEELVMVTAPWITSLARLAGRGARVKIVVFRSGCTYRARLEALLAERGVVGARRLEFGTLDGIVGCVAAGIGVTLLPRAAVARAQREGRVALHALPPADALVPTVLIRRLDAFTSAALAQFIALARGSLTSKRTSSARRSGHAERARARRTPRRARAVEAMTGNAYEAPRADGPRGALGIRIQSTR
jgi:DNA-binding transcriptional LysR family regulator